MGLTGLDAFNSAAIEWKAGDPDIAAGFALARKLAKAEAAKKAAKKKAKTPPKEKPATVIDPTKGMSVAEELDYVIGLWKRTPGYKEGTSKIVLKGGNIPRERLVKAGLTEEEIKKFDPAGTGFNLEILRQFYSSDHNGHIHNVDELGSIDFEIENKVIIPAKPRVAVSSSIDQLVYTHVKDEERLYLKDIRDLFTKANSGASFRRFSSAKKFEEFMERILFDRGNIVSKPPDLPDIRGRLQEAYRRYIKNGTRFNRAGIMKLDTFTAISLDVLFNRRNVYKKMIVDSGDPDSSKKGLRYFNPVQLRHLNSLLNWGEMTYYNEDD